VLARGFVLVRLPDGQIAKRAKDAADAARFQLLFADGEVAAQPAAAQGRLI
jgi:exonuclease VII large subunit